MFSLNRILKEKDEVLEKGLSGYGKLIFPKGTKFAGELALDSPAMQNEYLIPPRNTYIGDFYLFIPHGEGIMHYENDTIYEGAFQYGKKHGYGILNMENGDQYKGMFKNDLYDGSGTLYKNGIKVYEGEFKEGLPYSHGTSYYENGVTAEQFFEDQNTLVSNMTIRCPNKDIYEGICEDQVFNGTYTFINSNGETTTNIIQDRNLYDIIYQYSEDKQ
ncbi:hypothetical protein WA158_004175 [Blastocystis sp. Blastoise]